MEENAEEAKAKKDFIVREEKIVEEIVKPYVIKGYIPIVIGGGHNNAYGNIKGSALAHGKPVNAINFDAHSDFRILEGRHSGNGFRYAKSENYLHKYGIGKKSQRGRNGIFTYQSSIRLSYL